MRIALLDAHTAPHLRHEQADVVVHPRLGPDAAGGGKKTVVSGDAIGDEGGVEIVDRRQGVERTFRQCALRTGAGGGG